MNTSPQDKKPRRILIFSLTYYPRFIGGAEVTIKELTDRIALKDIEFDLITLRFDSQLPAYEKVGNVNVHRIGWTQKEKVFPSTLTFFLNLNKYAYLCTGYFKALSLHRQKKFDVIWSFMATYNSFAALFFKLTHPKIPFILTLQEGDPIEYIKRRARPLYPIFKLIFRKADYIQTISKFLATWAKEMGATCPITVVPNAVDLELFGKPLSNEKAEALKCELHKKEGDVFLITTGRLVEKNAVKDTISALTYLPAYVKFLIIGDGVDKAKLESQVFNLLLKDRVKFLGYVPHAEMPPYLMVSDIFIRPSLSEGLGNSFLEAMAAGIPVIATPVGGIPDFLIEGETGLFCEVNNPKSIAQKVEKILKDKESREYIVTNAKNMVMKSYDWMKIAQQIQTILTTIEVRKV
ncbi:MAG: glycosyltransferase family 4 protein [bacterium]|nr:glycosyltransferase family 4 protein [bacterium]